MRAWIVAACCLVGLGCGEDDEDPLRLGPVPVPRVEPADDDGSDDDGDDVGDPDFAIDATPESLNVPQGGTALISVKVERVDGFDEAIEVTVDGLPAGVAATPLTLGPTETSGTIALAAAETTAVPEATSARVRGHADAGTRSDRIDLTVRGEAGASDRSFDVTGGALAFHDVYDVDETSDGKLLLAGFSMSSGNRIACRADAGGKLDATFGSGGCVDESGYYAFGVEVIAQGSSVVVVGWSDGFTFVTRLSEDGTTDPAFGTLRIGAENVSQRPTAAVALEGGAILVAGWRNDGTLGGLKSFLAQVRADGTLDPAFGDGGQVIFEGPGALDFVRLAGGRIVVLNENGVALHGFLANGTVDTAFGTNGRAELPRAASALSRRGDGITAAVGGFAAVFVDGRGAVESMWAPLEPEEEGELTPSDIVVRSDGSIVFFGALGDRLAIARRDANGSLDAEFGIPLFDAGNISRDGEVLHDGRYLVSGSAWPDHGVLLRVWD